MPTAPLQGGSWTLASVGSAVEAVCEKLRLSATRFEADELRFTSAEGQHAVAAGRIVSAKTARSQISGGVVWGIGQALHEHTQCDHGLGRFMHHDLAEHHVPVNADVPDIEVLFVEEDDRIVSRLGAKGVGEIGMVGVARPWPMRSSTLSAGACWSCP